MSAGIMISPSDHPLRDPEPGASACGRARRRPSSKNRVLPVDLNQFDVEQLADAPQVGAVVAAGVACCEVGDDDCRAAVVGVEVLAREPECRGVPARMNSRYRTAWLMACR